MGPYVVSYLGPGTGQFLQLRTAGKWCSPLRMCSSCRRSQLPRGPPGRAKLAWNGRCCRYCCLQWMQYHTPREKPPPPPPPAALKWRPRPRECGPWAPGGGWRPPQLVAPAENATAVTCTAPSPRLFPPASHNGAEGGAPIGDSQTTGDSSPAAWRNAPAGALPDTPAAGE